MVNQIIMKSKILLLIGISICLTLASEAQFQKGDWLLGGTLGFNAANSSPGSKTSSNTNIAPHIGLSIGKHAVIGFDFSFSYSSGSSSLSNLFFSSYVFYRRYFVLKNKLGWYLQFNGGVGWSKDEYNVYDSAGNTSKTISRSQIYNLGITPGLYYQVAPRILLNADVGQLAYYYSNDGGGYSSSNLSFNFFNSYTFGVDFIL